MSSGSRRLGGGQRISTSYLIMCSNVFIYKWCIKNGVIKFFILNPVYSSARGREDYNPSRFYCFVFWDPLSLCCQATVSALVSLSCPNIKLFVVNSCHPAAGHKSLHIQILHAAVTYINGHPKAKKLSCCSFMFDVCLLVLPEPTFSLINSKARAPTFRRHYCRNSQGALELLVFAQEARKTIAKEKRFLCLSVQLDFCN